MLYHDNPEYFIQEKRKLFPLKNVNSYVSNFVATRQMQPWAVNLENRDDKSKLIKFTRSGKLSSIFIDVLFLRVRNAFPNLLLSFFLTW